MDFPIALFDYRIDILSGVLNFHTSQFGHMLLYVDPIFKDQMGPSTHPHPFSHVFFTLTSKYVTRTDIFLEGGGGKTNANYLWEAPLCWAI